MSTCVKAYTETTTQPIQLAMELMLAPARRGEGMSISLLRNCASRVIALAQSIVSLVALPLAIIVALFFMHTTSLADSISGSEKVQDLVQSLGGVVAHAVLIPGGILCALAPEIFWSIVRGLVQAQTAGLGALGGGMPVSTGNLGGGGMPTGVLFRFS